MFLKNWDAILLAAIYQGTTGSTFLKAYSGTAKSLNGETADSMLQIGLDDDDQLVPSIYYLRTSAGSKAGVIIGTGNTPPTYEDYKLSGNLITTFNYTSIVKKTFTDTGFTLSATFSITNSGTEAFTISEVGLTAGSTTSSTSTSNRFLIERTVLDSPVTIEPGAIGQVTYTININMPLV